VVTKEEIFFYLDKSENMNRFLFSRIPQNCYIHKQLG